MDQVCFEAGAGLVTILGSVVMAASSLANFVPDPDKIQNGVLRFLSRVLHFAAFDIVTGKK